MGGGRAWPGFEIDDSEPQVHAWREPRGPRSRAEVPVGGGRAWPGFEIDHSEPQARVWRSRGRPDPTAPGTPVGPQATSNIGNRAGRRPPAHTAPQQPAPTTTSTHNETRPRPVSRPRPRHSLSATHRSSGTASDQAVMSTWSSTAARPASRRATGTRNGEQDT